MLVPDTGVLPVGRGLALELTGLAAEPLPGPRKQMRGAAGAALGRRRSVVLEASLGNLLFLIENVVNYCAT